MKPGTWRCVSENNARGNCFTIAEPKPRSSWRCCTKLRIRESSKKSKLLRKPLLSPDFLTRLLFKFDFSVHRFLTSTFTHLVSQCMMHGVVGLRVTETEIAPPCMRPIIHALAKNYFYNELSQYLLTYGRVV